MRYLLLPVIAVCVFIERLVERWHIQSRFHVTMASNMKHGRPVWWQLPLPVRSVKSGQFSFAVQVWRLTPTVSCFTACCKRCGSLQLRVCVRAFVCVRACARVFNSIIPAEEPILHYCWALNDFSAGPHILSLGLVGCVCECVCVCRRARMSLCVICSNF